MSLADRESNSYFGLHICVLPYAWIAAGNCEIGKQNSGTGEIHIMALSSSGYEQP